jgi:hypothetical protein
MFEVCAHDLLYTYIAVYVQRMLTIVEVEGGEDTHQAKEVITVDMCDEYMIELAALDVVFRHLQLRAFAAVEQESLSVII